MSIKRKILILSACCLTAALLAVVIFLALQTKKATNLSMSSMTSTDSYAQILSNVVTTSSVAGATSKNTPEHSSGITESSGSISSRVPDREITSSKSQVTTSRIAASSSRAASSSATTSRQNPPDPPAQNSSTHLSSSSAPVSSEWELLNINTATLEQIKSIPGLPTEQAERIYDFRTKAGYFQFFSQIANVPRCDWHTVSIIEKYCYIGEY